MPGEVRGKLRLVNFADAQKLVKEGGNLYSAGQGIAALPDTVDALGTLPDPAAATLLDRLRGRDLLAMPYLPLPVAALVQGQLGGLIAPFVGIKLIDLLIQFIPGI